MIRIRNLSALLVHVLGMQVSLSKHTCQRLTQSIKAYIQSQLPKKMLNSRLKVSIYFYSAPPKSWTKNQKLISIGQYKRTKPDIDNLIKTVQTLLTITYGKMITKLHTLKALSNMQKNQNNHECRGSGVNG